MRQLGEHVESLTKSLDRAASLDGPDAGTIIGQLRESLEELRTAEAELRQQNEELIEARLTLEVERERSRELFDYAPDAYLVTDIRGVIRDANLAAEELFKRRRPMLIGKPIRLFVPVDDKTSFYALLSQVIRRGRAEDVQLELRAPASAQISVSARAFPQNGAPIEGIRWQLRDITERVAREEHIRQLNADLEERVRERTLELTRANAAKDEFLGLISHELKTPITVIGGNAETLTRHADTLTPEQRNDALADVRSEADRLQRIIDNLLVLARLEGGQDIGREPLRLDLLVVNRVRDHRLRFPHRRIEANVDGALVVDAAPVYVEQVLRNLISNAEKYSPADASIAVAAGTNDGEAVVSVTDEGHGIPNDEMGLLFTPFFRSQSTSERAPGAGIGLAVCKRLIEAQGGQIWARRRPEGGMEFSFALPALRDDDSAD